MQKQQILWADDEIDLLKPYLIFLDQKGYEVTPVPSGIDAIEECKKRVFDLVFLDENMPGMTGLETLSKIKALKPNLPVVMITKSEEEQIMEQAIGSKIADYLIKPLNPNQILLSVKKILDNKRLVSETTNKGYQTDFQAINMAVSDSLNHEEWADLYKKIVFWELEMAKSQDKTMLDVLESQKESANDSFIKFIEKNYESWLNEPNINKPLLSHRIVQKKVLPLLEKDCPVFFIVIDNFRLDQWKVVQNWVEDLYHLDEDSHYYSILPTATAYARNALFAGMMPTDIAKYHPQFWVNEDEEGSKNNFESELLGAQLQKLKPNTKHSYHKILNADAGKLLLGQLHNLYKNDINAIVFNFVDMLSHARTDIQMIRELAADESAYRSITKSWFEHSALQELLQILAEKKVKVVITTDHGTVRVEKAVKVVGDRETNTNLRYKQGRNLTFNEKDVMFTRKPERLFLPKKNISTTYIFAKGNQFLAYPNNYNHYVNYYKNTFQHGGISMEEVIVPYIVLSPKK